MPTALLSSTYFGPVQWYQKLYRYDHCLIERHDSYVKQTYRNRCLIATTNGVQALTVPTKAPSNLPPKGEAFEAPSNLPPKGEAFEVTAAATKASPFGGRLEGAGPYISDHGNWRHQHWQALQSAYGDSPFFEYYEDDLRPFFTERWELLYDFNEAIRVKMCELLDIRPHVSFTTEYIRPDTLAAPDAMQGDPALHDFRDSIQPKHPAPDPDFQPRPYYQVYRSKHGFLPNLSILDLLLNMGPESIFFL